jgi:hypothetical protein
VIVERATRSNTQTLETEPEYSVSARQEKLREGNLIFGATESCFIVLVIKTG